MDVQEKSDSRKHILVPKYRQGMSKDDAVLSQERSKLEFQPFETKAQMDHELLYSFPNLQF